MTFDIERPSILSLLGSYTNESVFQIYAGNRERVDIIASQISAKMRAVYNKPYKVLELTVVQEDVNELLYNFLKSANKCNYCVILRVYADHPLQFGQETIGVAINSSLLEG